MATLTYVLAKDGTPLMPTTNVKKVRKLLRSERAKKIGYLHGNIVIQLQYETTKNTQPIEYSCDTGYLHVGISIKSEKHEYVSGQFDMLPDETEKHNDRRKYRRTRRNRLRYRKPRFNNRTSSKSEGWLAPSIQNKADTQCRLFEEYKKYLPITTATFEMGQFDTQVLEAVEKGKPIPKGLDYQHGPTYSFDTLREAVFQRDNYTCIVCGRSAITDGITLCLHHLGFRIGDRSNRIANLGSTCKEYCHNHKNHKPGGALYDLKPELKSFKGAAFMNSVKWYMYDKLKTKFKDVEFHITYGAVTKRERLSRNLTKSHTNDAYCIGKFRPKHRTISHTYQKKRRNNRILEKFYDAVYYDIRDKKLKKGAQLSCGRTNRSIPRNNPNNERINRGHKIKKGRRVIRKEHYSLRPGDKVMYKNQWYTVKGIQNKGTYVKLKEIKKVPSVSNITKIIHTNAWEQIV